MALFVIKFIKKITLSGRKFLDPPMSCSNFLVCVPSSLVNVYVDMVGIAGYFAISVAT